MIPYHYQSIAPLIEPYARYVHLTSPGSSFGELITDDEHIVRRLNSFVGNLENPYPYELQRIQTSIPYPMMDREKVYGPVRHSDVLLKDVSRQHMGVEERYRKGLVPLDGFRALSDGATRFHLASSRGMERRLIHQINRLDGEFINRASLRPIIQT